MSVCVVLCMYACVRAHVHACVHVCVCLCVCVRACVCVHVISFSQTCVNARDRNIFYPLMSGYMNC